MSTVHTSTQLAPRTHICCLANIDSLIDGAFGYKPLCFVDAYSWYNQIKMDPHDTEKTTFMTESCNYCYTVMPFSLKNVGATNRSATLAPTFLLFIVIAYSRIFSLEESWFAFLSRAFLIRYGSLSVSLTHPRCKAKEKVKSSQA